MIDLNSILSAILVTCPLLRVLCCASKVFYIPCPHSPPPLLLLLLL